MASYLSSVLIITFSVQAGHADPSISTSTPTPCYGDVVTLVCHHPELASNPGKYFDSDPGWRENNTKITTTGIYIEEDTSDDHRATTFTVNITVEHFKNKAFTYLCLLVLVGDDGEPSGSERSGVVTVDPIEPTRPDKISIITCHNTSIAFDWTHSPKECYEDRIRYHVSWVNVDNSTDNGSDTVEATKYNITNLSSGNTYTISVQSVLVRDVMVRSEPLPREVTTGKPLVHCKNQVACYTRNFTLFCEISSIHFGQYSSIYWTLNSLNLTESDLQSNKYHLYEDGTQLDIRKVERDVVGDYGCSIVLYNTTHIGGKTYPLHPLGSPNEPHNIKTAPGATNITVSWDHDNSCFRNYTFIYNVTWQKASTSEEREYMTVNITTFTIPNLASNTNYSICVLAVSNSDTQLKSRARCLHNKTSSKEGVDTTTTTAIAVPISVSAAAVLLIICAVGILIGLIVYCRRKWRKQANSGTPRIILKDQRPPWRFCFQ